MTVFQMKLAMEIARTGSITAAAGIMKISQPNASTSLKRLEEELGCSLFERRAGRWVPNEHGALFLEHAVTMIREDTALRSVCKMESISRLRLGVMNYTPAADAFISLCEEKTDVPLADYSCVFVSFDEALNLLREHAIDMAICFSMKTGIERDIKLCNEDKLELNVIREIPISLRLRNNHPLAETLLNEPDPENFRLLSQYPYAEHSNITNLLQVYNETAAHTFGYSYKIRVSGADMRLKTVGRTNAYNIGAHLPAERCRQYGIVSIPIGDETSCIVSLTRKDAFFTDDMNRYLELLSLELDRQME